MTIGIVWDESFSISKFGILTEFLNNSEKLMIVHIKPKKPKTKVISRLVVPPGARLLDEYNLDLTKIYISFEN